MKTGMKKLFALASIILMLFYAQAGKSQILISILLGDKLNSGAMEFGLEGGFNRSYLSGISEAKGLNNFHIGFYFDIRIKNQWYLNTGVRVKTNMGARKINPYLLNDPELDSVFDDGNITRKIGYFYVPVHIKYIFAGRFFINLGFQAGLRNSADDHFLNSYFEKDDVDFRYDIRDQVKRLDFGLSGGTGYKFMKSGMNLGITYYYGLVDIMKTADLNSHPSTFYLYLDIPIGAGYKEQKTQEKD